MIIAEVEQLLTEHDPASPLTIEPLLALEPRPEPYVAMLCQHHGTIQATPQRIGNLDSAGTAQRFVSFLRRAAELHADLALTPEYSVPWTVIEEVASGHLLPPTGALWALGFESITPRELEALRARLANAAQPTRLLHEPFDPREVAQKKFVDPLVYIFWARDRQGTGVLCVLVQFKTRPSRDPQHVETDNLYLGHSVYKFNARANKIALLGLMCSDAFGFTDLVNAHHNDLLVIHLQLNQRPAHGDYAAYRQRLYQVASNSRIEIVCLNWAVNVMADGEVEPWNRIAGSAWYLTPNSIKPTDNDIDQLHRAGLYYSIAGQRWHGFYLHYEPHYLVVRKQRLRIEGPQALAQRLLPEVIGRNGWDESTRAWVPKPADDGFTSFVRSYSPLDTSLPALNTESPLAVERALELLAGPMGSAETWHSLSQLDVLRVAEEESLRRVTVSQETDPTRGGVVYRTTRTRHAQTAIRFPAEALAWLPSVADLSGGFRFRWSMTAPHNNVEPTNTGRGPATLVYLGENPEQATIVQMYSKLRTALIRHALDVAAGNSGVRPDFNAEAKRAEDRLCIVFRRDGHLQVFRPADYVSYTEPANLSPTDITGGGA
jgi:hypothetical protein